MTKIVLETTNFRVEQNENGNFKFSELQRDNLGQMFPVQLKTVQEYHTLASELAKTIGELVQDLNERA